MFICSFVCLCCIVYSKVILLFQISGTWNCCFLRFNVPLSFSFFSSICPETIAELSLLSDNVAVAISVVVFVEYYFHQQQIWRENIKTIALVGLTVTANRRRTLYEGCLLKMELHTCYMLLSKWKKFHNIYGKQ